MQQPDAVTQLDSQIAALDTRLNALNFEFLAALNSPEGRSESGKTAVEIAASVIDQSRVILSDKEKLDQRRQLIQQWADAELAPRAFRERAERFKTLGEQVQQLVMEVRNAESQAKAASSRAESGRQSAIEQLRATGLNTDALNNIQKSIQIAKGK